MSGRHASDADDAAERGAGQHAGGPHASQESTAAGAGADPAAAPAAPDGAAPGGSGPPEAESIMPADPAQPAADSARGAGPASAGAPAVAGGEAEDSTGAPTESAAVVPEEQTGNDDHRGTNVAHTDPTTDQDVDNGHVPIDVGVAEAEPIQSGASAELAKLRTELSERTADLQRLTAEYANYRKRVDRDRALVVEQATGNVLAALLPVLDDLDRARDHGDLVGPFGTVADNLIGAVTKFGLTPFGAKGDVFDPNLHEAVAHTLSETVEEPTCVEVMRRGYLLGERLLRPAMVAVADPQ